MKAILYVVALLVIGGATYFTIEHNRKFEEHQAFRLKTIATNKQVSTNADATETELGKEKKVLADSEQKRTELTESIDVLKTNGSSLERDMAEIDNTIQGQDEEFAELTKTMEEVNRILKALAADFGGEEITLDNLSEKIEAIEEEKKARQAKLEDLETLVGGAEKLLAQNRAEVDRLVKRDLDRNVRISRNSMESVVTAVDQDWGFLVIGAGSNSGFTPQTALIVQRGGRMIGRVNPSSIEPTQTIAEIDFKSLATGVRIQPGDRVILADPLTN
jgi:predicted  nucleic acid-binding Zn-ribbon protein